MARSAVWDPGAAGQPTQRMFSIGSAWLSSTCTAKAQVPNKRCSWIGQSNPWSPTSPPTLFHKCNYQILHEHKYAFSFKVRAECSHALGQRGSVPNQHCIPQLQCSVPGGIPRLEAPSCSADRQRFSCRLKIRIELLPKTIIILSKTYKRMQLFTPGKYIQNETFCIQKNPIFCSI